MLSQENLALFMVIISSLMQLMVFIIAQTLLQFLFLFLFWSHTQSNSGVGYSWFLTRNFSWQVLGSMWDARDRTRLSQVQDKCPSAVLLLSLSPSCSFSEGGGGPCSPSSAQGLLFLHIEDVSVFLLQELRICISKGSVRTSSLWATSGLGNLTFYYFPKIHYQSPLSACNMRSHSRSLSLYRKGGGQMMK